MGYGTILALLSTQPEYSEKVKPIIGLGPQVILLYYIPVFTCILLINTFH